MSFQKGFVCRLHSFFHSVVRISLKIHHASLYLEIIFKREFLTPFWCTQKSYPPFLQKRTCSSTTSLQAGSRSTFAASSMRYFSICSKCVLEWDTIQKLSAHMKLQIWCAPPNSKTIKTAFALFHPHWPLSVLSSFTTSVGLPLSRTSIESKIAFHTLKHGLVRQARHLTQEGRNDPSVCIVTVHDLRHVLQPCLIEGRLDIQAGPVQCWSYHHPVFHHGIPFPLPLPMFLCHISSSSLACVGNLSHPIHQCVTSSIFLAPFLSPNATGCMMHTTSTSPTSELLLCTFWFLWSWLHLASSRTPVSPPSTKWETPSCPWNVPESTSLSCNEPCTHLIWLWLAKLGPLWFLRCVRPL